MIGMQCGTLKTLMTHRERTNAVLCYEPFDRIPIVHFGFWKETLLKWAEEGHIAKREARTWRDGNTTDVAISAKLGFDFNWCSMFHPNLRLDPGFRRRVVERFPDGSRHVVNYYGAIIIEKPNVVSIPSEIRHGLRDRANWKRQYKKRYKWNERRVNSSLVRAGDRMIRFDQGGLEFLKSSERDYPYGLFCGSLYGQIRNLLGLEKSCTMWAEDPELLVEIIDTVGELSFQCVKYVLAGGARFDFAHFWEDICCKNGPLVHPTAFAEKVGPHYKRITELLREYDIDIVSLDCDGKIDALLPIWLTNGVNTMFPIEVGTWGAGIAPWRQQYGRTLRGVGGMNKHVFARDCAAVEDEIQRLKPLVALGGYIPCPDHRISPEAKWKNVQYYCRRMREEFSR